ncbi:hypothetical protein BH11PSE2_BH11PSE2_05920 [soil metagenome]
MSRGWQMFWLSVASLASVGASPVAAVGVIFSPLVFDHQGSLLNPLAWLAFLLVITLWIVCLLGPFTAWVSFTRGDQRRAWVLISIVPVWATVMSLLLVLLGI